MGNSAARYRAELSKRLSGNEVFLYWKGRVALYALLQACGVKAGDEVILQAYTCVVVPNAVIYLGAKPIYVDVDASSYNMGVEQLKAKITDKTKVIICQNTYGLSTDLEAIVDLAGQHGIYTIEDCTHGFGGSYNGVPNGNTCDCAIYSSQWNKPFSTGVGGFSVVNNPDLISALAEVNGSLEEPPLADIFQLGVLLTLYSTLLNNRTYWFLRRLYRFMSKAGIVVGSSSATEIVSTEKPTGYFRAMSGLQAWVGLRQLRKLDKKLVERKANGQIFSEQLREWKKIHVPACYFENHGFLTYPLLVIDRSEFVAKSEQMKVQLGDWFISPIHPVLGEFESWGISLSDFPVARQVSSHVVNIPTDSSKQSAVIKLLKNQRSNLMNIGDLN